MDLVNSPVVQAPEPYCLRNKGAVVGKCNNIRRHCETGQQYPMDPECLCNRETGSIEKCSKYSCRRLRVAFNQSN
jgi:hypothetical protein